MQRCKFTIVKEVVDRIRVASNAGQNLRLNPDTGAVVDFRMDLPGVQADGNLSFAAGDANAGRTANIVASAYTNPDNNPATGTELYDIDAAQDILVTQGSEPGVMPVVSPNSGQLFTDGALGVNVGDVAGFDIGAGNIGFVATGGASSTLYRINLNSGALSRVSAIGEGISITSLAIAP